jgi:hypothetical protein
MSHETREGRKIGDDIRHNHFEAAHKEISHEMHAHPKEFEKTLKSINKDLAKHHENPLSVERDSKNQISHINFHNHDIYSSPSAEAEKKGAEMPKAAAPDAQRTAPGEAPRAGAPDAQKPAPSDNNADTRNPERDSRERQPGDERHHRKHHRKHGGKHGRGGRGEGGGEENDSDDPKDNTDPKNNGKPGDVDPNAKPGDPKDPTNKDAAGSPRDPAAKAPDGSATAPGADGLRGRDNAEKAMNYFLDKGLTKAQAAGIVGNLNHESPGVNPDQHQHNGGPGYGIAQWEGSRKKEEKQYAKEHGKPAGDLKTQLDFAWQELNTTHRGALRGVERAHTPSQAARAFERGFERASKPNMRAREQNALYAYNRPSGDIDGEALATSR